MKIALIIVSVISIQMFTSGCGLPQAPPTPKDGYKGRWEPEWEDPVEVRSLAPSISLPDDYREWRLNDGVNIYKSRCYIEAISNVKMQSSFSVRHYMAITPIGKTPYTEARFVYSNPNKGEYVFLWKMRGVHKPDFLRADITKKYLLFYIGTDSKTGLPLLQVLGVEGCGPNEASFGGDSGLKDD